MERPIRPAWLLRQADELGYRYAGRGRPRSANLRRAASAAYYARYHAMGLHMARHLLPRARPTDHHRATRSLTHEAIRTVCQWIIGSATPPEHVSLIATRLGQNQDLVDTCTGFLELREARNEADYDHLADFTKPRTLALVDLAREAVTTLNAMRKRRDPDLESYFALVALKTSIR